MKAIKNTLTILCLMSLIIASCGKNHTKQLAKTWQVNDIESSTTLTDSVKNQMIQNSQISFTKDNSYTSTGGIGADQGTYTLDKDGKTLSTISTSGKSNSVYTIEKLSDDKLVLKNNGNTVSFTAIK